MDKDALRQRMRLERRLLTPAQQEEAAAAAFAHLAAYAPYRTARTVMAYVAARGELSLCGVIGDVLASGRTLALPRCETPGVMTARRVTDISQLRPGAFGLFEPGEGCDALPPDAIDLILVPGTAFDRLGGRVGQGGGYYDRFLAGTRALCVGVCHGFALHERVPTQPHDAVMDAILTPDGLFARKRKQETADWPLDQQEEMK